MQENLKILRICFITFLLILFFNIERNFPATSTEQVAEYISLQKSSAQTDCSTAAILEKQRLQVPDTSHANIILHINYTRNF